MGLGDPGEEARFKGSFTMNRSNGSCFTDEEMCMETFHSHPKAHLDYRHEMPQKTFMGSKGRNSSQKAHVASVLSTN